MQQPTIGQTIDFIIRAHAGQLDKSGKPYHLHPISVMERLDENAPVEYKLAALLHDVLEDTDYTRDDLAELGYCPEVLDIVELVTFEKDHIPYPAKIRGIIESGNEGAIRVKFADMSDNSSRERLVDLPEEDQQRLRRKYQFPLQMLKAAVEALDIIAAPEKRQIAR